jgi:HEPN domain-containing protein
MLDRDELSSIARARLDDADALVSAGRHDGAVYVCGYAVELGLKARICKTLRWEGYPETGKEFEAYRSFKTHDLVVLLRLSGVEEDVKKSLPFEWSVVAQWNPESRYGPVDSSSEDEARSMIESARAVLGEL